MKDYLLKMPLRCAFFIAGLLLVILPWWIGFGFNELCESDCWWSLPLLITMIVIEVIGFFVIVFALVEDPDKTIREMKRII